MSMGSRRPTPRGRREVPSNAATIAFCLLMIALIAFAATWGMTHTLPTEAEQRPVRKITHDSLTPTYTYDGEIIRWYVLIDPDTSVQYLVNDRGGCTPRLDQYGNIIGVQGYD